MKQFLIDFLYAIAILVIIILSIFGLSIIGMCLGISLAMFIEVSKTLI